MSIFCIFCYFLLVITPIIGNYQTVCKTRWDYLVQPFTKNCWHNPDVDADMPYLVTQHGYPLEDYYITTSDGYILHLYRLPNKASNKGVVYLQHPASATCTCWVDKGNASLGFILYHAGFDIWLGNFRGSYYSRNHTKLDPEKDEEYWNFSYHEMGVYDIPEQINFIKKITKVRKLAFVGHSMSGTSAVVYASLLRYHAVENINLFVLMAPTVYLTNIQSPLRLFSPMEKFFYMFAKQNGIFELFPRNTETRKQMQKCYTTNLMDLCLLLQDTIYGEQSGEIHWPYVPVMYSQDFAGVSIKSISHYAQNLNAGGKFRQYDYRKGNKKMYNLTEPPEYPVENIRSSFLLFNGENDLVTTNEDTEFFYNKVLKHSGTVQYGLKEIQGFNHLSFLYGKNAKKKVYEPIIEVMEKIDFS